MKIYMHYLARDAISCETIEVEEKEKTFKEIRNVNPKTYKKDMLNILQIGYHALTMLSLSSDPAPFIKKCIEHKRGEINLLQEKTAAEINNLIKIQINNKEILTERKTGMSYATCGYIQYEKEGEFFVGNKETYEKDYLVLIHNLNDIGEFINHTVPENKKIYIWNIFVNGNNTNLGIEGLYNIQEKGLCVVPINRLEKLAERYQVIIDYHIVE